MTNNNPILALHARGEETRLATTSRSKIRNIGFHGLFHIATPPNRLTHVAHAPMCIVTSASTYVHVAPHTRRCNSRISGPNDGIPLEFSLLLQMVPTLHTRCRLTPLDRRSGASMYRNRFGHVEVGHRCVEIDLDMSKWGIDVSKSVWTCRSGASMYRNRFGCIEAGYRCVEA